MITNLCNLFGLSQDQTRLTVIYVIGAIAQTLAIWYMDTSKVHIPLFAFYLIITIVWSITYYKLFTD